MAKGKIFYDKIKSKRMEKDATQQEVAELLGIPRPTYASFELGKQDFDVDKLRKLSDILDISIDEIYIEGFKNTIVVPLLNNKGGSAKTTVSNGLSYVLATEGYKVLAIDSDAQMNLTHSLGILERDPEINLNTALVNESSFLDFIKPTKYENLDIIIADYALSTIESKLPTKAYRETLFRRLIRPIIDKGIYDYIIIDTSPNLALLNFNIMLASNFCLIPCSIEPFALDGLEILTGFIKECKQHNPELEILGITKTKVDKREGKLLKQTNKVLQEHFGSQLFESFIPIDIKIKQAQWENIPVNVLAANGKSDKHYKELAKEFIKKIKR
jgi:chromosome partitioning protein